MTTCRRGVVVLVSVVFTGQAGSKPRPALVVSADSFHKEVAGRHLCPISSQPRFSAKPGPGDHPLERWKAAGLRHPSTVRVSKPVAVERKVVKRVLGAAHADDLAAVEQKLRTALGL